MLACSSCFNRGIEREQVRLSRHIRDENGDLADFFRHRLQALNRLYGLLYGTQRFCNLLHALPNPRIAFACMGVCMT
ncbi:hypothetical protein D3C85_1375650 [compost metagenome]